MTLSIPQIAMVNSIQDIVRAGPGIFRRPNYSEPGISDRPVCVAGIRLGRVRFPYPG